MPQPVGQSSAAPLHQNACPHRMESLPASNVTPAHIRRNPSRAPQRARNEMMLLDILFTLFLTHVGSLTTLKSNQRRFAPTPAHIAGIKCPHHRNKHCRIGFDVLLCIGCKTPIHADDNQAGLVCGPERCCPSCEQSHLNSCFPCTNDHGLPVKDNLCLAAEMLMPHPFNEYGGEYCAECGLPEKQPEARHSGRIKVKPDPESEPAIRW
jgi:hypothetical protein